MKRIVLKLSGKIIDNEENLKILSEKIKSASNFQFIIIHGGGIQITNLYKKLKIEPEFVDGLRITSWEEMEIVEMVLSGIVNKKIVNLFLKNDIDTIGISGRDNLLFGKPKEEKLKRVGIITKVNIEIFDKLKSFKAIVISPVSNDEDFLPLNVNADDAATAIAIALKVEYLFLFSDVEGVLDKNGNVIEKINESKVEELINYGVVKEGMIVKLKSSIEAIKKGVKNIIITKINNSFSFDNIDSNNFKKTIISS